MLFRSMQAIGSRRSFLARSKRETRLIRDTVLYDNTGTGSDCYGYDDRLPARFRVASRRLRWLLERHAYELANARRYSRHSRRRARARDSPGASRNRREYGTTPRIRSAASRCVPLTGFETLAILELRRRGANQGGRSNCDLSKYRDRLCNEFT